jgi:hypothetical protein
MRCGADRRDRHRDTTSADVMRIGPTRLVVTVSTRLLVVDLAGGLIRQRNAGVVVRRR